MAPELMARDLVDSLWDSNHTGSLFETIVTNRCFVTRNGIKWHIDREEDALNLALYAQKKFYTLSQQLIKPRNKLIQNYLTASKKLKTLGYDVSIDFSFEVIGDEGRKRTLSLPTIVFRHTFPVKSSKLKLLC